MRRVLGLSIMAVMILSVSIYAYAGPQCGGCAGKTSCEASSGEIYEESKEIFSEPVNVGNMYCPVSGGKISEERVAKAVFEGKEYNLCCQGCIVKFNEDPEKYIRIVEEELVGEEATE